MATQATAAKRYAKALWESLGGNSVAEKAEAVLTALSKNIQESKDLRLVLESPGYSFENKSAVLISILDGYQAAKEVKNFVKVVLEAGRILMLEDMVAAFRALRLKSENAADAKVETALALGQDEERALAAFLEKKFGLRPVFNVRVNPELVAGMKVSLAGKTLDSTFVNKVEKLKKELLRATN